MGGRLYQPEDFDDFVFKTGDELTVTPAELAKTMHVTPDGSLHVPVQGGKAIRVPKQIEMFSFGEFEIPAHLILLTGAGAETLEPIGAAHIANYEKFMGLEADMTILEIGCGIGRDALQLINKIGPEGRYIGIDVTNDSIHWCRKNIGSKYPNFEFHHFDAKHEIYNPLGTKTTLDFRLPVENNSVDRILLGSVFTHLFKEEVVHYLKEIARALKPSGLAYATFFLYSEKTIEAARKTDLTPFALRFEHAFGDGCYVNDAMYPTGAVAYTGEVMLRMIEGAGLRRKGSFLKGWWSGAYEHPDDGQEVAILSKQP